MSAGKMQNGQRHSDMTPKVKPETKKHSREWLCFSNLPIRFYMGLAAAEPSQIAGRRRLIRLCRFSLLRIVESVFASASRILATGSR